MIQYFLYRALEIILTLTTCTAVKHKLVLKSKRLLCGENSFYNI